MTFICRCWAIALQFPSKILSSWPLSPERRNYSLPSLSTAKERPSPWPPILHHQRSCFIGCLCCTRYANFSQSFSHHHSNSKLSCLLLILADLGDYNPEEHEGNYASDLRLLLKQTPQIEEKIMELHQTHLVGQSPQEVETNFLRRASTLDTYGVDPHPVKV